MDASSAGMLQRISAARSSTGLINSAAWSSFEVAACSRIVTSGGTLVRQARFSAPGGPPRTAPASSDKLEQGFYPPAL